MKFYQLPITIEPEEYSFIKLYLRSQNVTICEFLNQSLKDLIEDARQEGSLNVDKIINKFKSEIRPKTDYSFDAPPTYEEMLEKTKNREFI